MKNKFFSRGVNILLGILSVLIILALFFSYQQFSPEKNTQAGDYELEEQTATIEVIKKNMPAVVNISVYETRETVEYDLSRSRKQVKEEEVKVGAGTGFIVSPDGLILTNKHVVKAENPKNTKYRIILSSGKEYYAMYLDEDPLNDLAMLRIYDQDLPYVDLGDSDKVKVGSTVVAIGNALGKYQNTVTKGIVSGLGRDFVASDSGGEDQVLNNTIQTDAEINFGNSGGPLIDLQGEVIGVNVAIDQAGNSIGFAIPINEVKSVIKSVERTNRIIRPRLGVRYIMINPEIAHNRDLPRESGALIIGDKEKNKVAVLSDSPAQKAGLRAGDIIFEINAIKINEENNLQKIIQKYKPGDSIGLKVRRGEKIFIRELTLDQFDSGN